MSALRDALVAADHHPQSYSGRGMYGKRCVGLTIERGDNIADALADAAQRIVDDCEQDKDAAPMLMTMLDEARGMCSDSMGMGTVYYWPHLAWEGEDDPDPEDD